jgi:hypothetical protein
MAFAAAWDEGRAMTLQQVLALVAAMLADPCPIGDRCDELHTSDVRTVTPAR